MTGDAGSHEWPAGRLSILSGQVNETTVCRAPYIGNKAGTLDRGFDQEPVRQEGK